MHSSFRQALNFRLDGELFSLLGQGQALAPAGMIVGGRPDFTRFAPGVRVLLTADEIVVAGQPFSLRAAAVASTAIADHGPPDERRISELAAVLSQWLSRDPPAHGWFDSLHDEASPYAPAVRRGWLALQAAVRAGDEDALVRACSGLVGLGPGLTPSGDDFLLGMFLVLHWRAPALGARILAQAAHGASTTDVSQAMLRRALQGYASLLYLAVLDPGTDLESALARAGAFGHSSGHDCLCGMLFAVQHG
ncbi:DUF2877 domain-containing protein [Rubrivivax gelatinosus]|uniref:DUF2877 domain-containing protein n=1 Tax=Rubrivivax gelatinosus TaxID=28068 RepID=UPI0014045BE8|nr:DUF2877 domain-containing protein [Rubrivivax gelatinosus]